MKLEKHGTAQGRSSGSKAGLAKPASCGIGALSPRAVNERIRSGFDVRELEKLGNGLGIPVEEAALKVGISRATLHRRKRKGRLQPDESDRVYRYLRLMVRAVEVMESEEAARRWLSSPQVGLGGAKPMNYAETEAGAREVEDLLGRIEFGVYS